MPFSVEAEVPMVWECRVCGAQALRVGGTAEEEHKPAKPARTHWDMLLERRSIPELEEVLAERLALLRDGGFGGRRAAVRAVPPVNLATGAPVPGAGEADAGSTKTAAKKTTTAKKKTTAGTGPAKKAADRPARKAAAKKP
jgi:hypothetical protein